MKVKSFNQILRHLFQILATPLRRNILSVLLNSDLSIEGFFVEIRLSKKTWLLCSSYNPKKNVIVNQLNCIGRDLDSQLGQYENFIFMGDFTLEPKMPL